MRSSADHPSSVRATRASQFSSQSAERSLSLKRMLSERTPAALTENSNALVPLARESIATVTESASIGRSRRVSRATSGARCAQSKPTYSVSRSYSTRTVVRSDGGLPSSGNFCVKASLAGADRHAGSSSLPSSFGASTVGVASRRGAAPATAARSAKIAIARPSTLAASVTHDPFGSFAAIAAGAETAQKGILWRMREGRWPVVFVPHGGGPWPFVDLGRLVARGEAEALASYLRAIPVET